jgi:hypothetical protein
LKRSARTDHNESNRIALTSYLSEGLCADGGALRKREAGPEEKKERFHSLK